MSSETDTPDETKNINDKLAKLQIKGDDVQKLCVIHSVPDLAKIDRNACYSKIIPRIQQTLSTSSVEFHVATSRLFYTLLEENLPAEILVSSAIQELESWDSTISSAWYNALISGINSLPVKIVCSEILPVAKKKGEPNQNNQSRIASCRLLGRIAAHESIDPFIVKKEVLPSVHALCQDVNHEVRAAICQQLPFVALGLGAPQVKSNLLPCLVELSTDESVIVRIAAAEIMTQMFQYLSDDVMKYTIIPMIIKLCEQSIRLDDPCAVIIAREIGPICQKLSPFLTLNNAVFLINSYKQLALRGIAIEPGESHGKDPYQDVMCREHCAFNLPAMTTYTLSVCPHSIDQLYLVFTALASDPCYLIRRSVASGLHEVAKSLMSQVVMIKDEIVKLLRDDSEDVLQSLVPNVMVILLQLTKYNVLQIHHVDGTTVEFSKALLKCEALIGNSHNWRLYTEFLKQLECLPSVFPGDFIFSQFLPLLFDKIVKGRAKPIRHQAGRTILKVLRYNIKPQQKAEIRNRIITDLCNSNCCYTRSVFIQVCGDLFELFSTNYFKEYFYIPLLGLTDDKVANVRLCVILLFPKLKSMIRLPKDRALYTMLEDTVAKLMANERDRDCLQILHTVMSQLKNTKTLKDEDELDPVEQMLLNEENQSTTGSKNKAKQKPAPYSIRNDIKRELRPPAREPAMLQRQSNSRVQSQQSFASREERQSTSGRRPPPTTTKPPAPSDMSILQQHFYIDAGIEIPINLIQNSTAVDNNVVAAAAAAANNKTRDRVKTNNSAAAKYRKAESNSSSDSVSYRTTTGAIPKLTKRYSMIENNRKMTNNDTNSALIKSKRFSSSDLPTMVLSNDVVTNKRRSLDLMLSKIPVKSINNSLVQPKINKPKMCQKVSIECKIENVVINEAAINIVDKTNTTTITDSSSSSVLISIVDDAPQQRQTFTRRRRCLAASSKTTDNIKDNNTTSSVVTDKVQSNNNNNNSKFVRNGRNRYSLPTGSSLPVSIKYGKSLV